MLLFECSHCAHCYTIEFTLRAGNWNILNDFVTQQHIDLVCYKSYKVIYKWSNTHWSNDNREKSDSASVYYDFIVVTKSWNLVSFFFLHSITFILWMNFKYIFSMNEFQTINMHIDFSLIDSRFFRWSRKKSVVCVSLTVNLNRDTSSIVDEFFDVMQSNQV